MRAIEPTVPVYLWLGRADMRMGLKRGCALPHSGLPNKRRDRISSVGLLLLSGRTS